MATSGMIKITFEAMLKLDRIQRAADRASQRIQRRSGAIVRTIMRRSIRFRKNKKSSPGEIPFTHVRSGAFGLRKIMYDYDPQTKTTIIGPVGGTERTGAPKALEFSGRSRIKLSPRDRRRLNRKFKTVTIRKRSFARPALDAFAKAYPDLWKDSIV